MTKGTFPTLVKVTTTLLDFALTHRPNFMIGKIIIKAWKITSKIKLNTKLCSIIHILRKCFCFKT